MRISFPTKKIIFAIIFNLSLFLILMIGIQNSSNQKKVNLIFSETVELPVSFIIGISLICGSLTGSFVNIKSTKYK
mgnify:CR=1 FL=1